MTKANKPKKTTSAKAQCVEPVPLITVASPQGKVERIVALMQRPEGAELAELMEATGWQAHSVRGAISGSIKRRLGHTVVSQKEVDVRVYRIQTGGAA